MAQLLCTTAVKTRHRDIQFFQSSPLLNKPEQKLFVVKPTVYLAHARWRSLVVGMLRAGALVCRSLYHFSSQTDVLVAAGAQQAFNKYLQ